jgi:hypothetical protein
VFPGRHFLHTLARLGAGQGRPIFFLFALVTFGVLAAPSIAQAQQLNMTWVDNSGGQASFIIQRATGTTGLYAQIAQVPLGVVSYTDTTVSLGTTYCYRVAAVNSTGMSAFSNIACASPSGGRTISIAKAGTGSGTVVSSPAGISCGAICSYTFPLSSVVTLTATPASGSTFTGWSGGGCSGTGPCILVGNVPVTVTATFAITVANPAPTLTSLSPSSALQGGPAVTLTVNGSGFVPASTVRWNGSIRTTTFVSATRLTASIPASDLTIAGSASVTVVTPAPGGGTSSALSFTITIKGPGMALSTTTAPSGGSITQPAA